MVHVNETTLSMFPGQGSQRARMAGHLTHDHPRTAGRVLAEATDVLGLPLTELCTTADAAALEPTEIAQPAILATSLAVLAVLREEAGHLPSVVAGHSLGEYTALVAAGVLSPADALRLVRRRGELMAAVSRRVSGAMTAVMGLAPRHIEAICARSAPLGRVEVANYNERGQTVVSGERAAVAEAARLAEEAGAERTVPLKVSAPFHCSLMREIEDEFGAELERCRFADPDVLVLSSVSGGPVRDGAHARELLRRQLVGPVRWVDVLDAARAHGVTAYVEIGPGRVLSGFAHRTVPDATVRSTNDARRLGALVRDLSPPATGSGAEAA
ncbi:malonyl CoA-acyl carrier protein transacylase [Streptomyces capillispiralis]|uniref:Malonyl CoA-acyl carrier protein transacylase n=1 Tax=Streptomyces capillispiralis TaxID=68182 RepID=A0A561TCC0_9ACTN|nr:[acyl-carrier-protein] S-malonyltransferase [Streptomyces capillispiralis]GHH96127.1 malonyl CoA-acyl carrier protein transacylase [Streptomyces capillispiralis]